MPVNVTALNASITALANQATATVGTEDSAELILNGFAAAISKAVSDALTADAAANQGSIDAAQAAIDQVTAQFSASAAKLGAAVAANPGPPSPPAPPLAP